MSITNRLTVSALCGEGTIVTLDATDALATLPTLSVGTKATVDSSHKIGYVSRVDAFGRTFVVTPPTRKDRFDSLSIPGELLNGGTITLG